MKPSAKRAAPVAAFRDIVPRRPLAVITCIAAALACASFTMGDGGFDGFGTPRPAALDASTPDPVRHLSERLDELASRAVILPEQRPAWRAFTASILQLEQATRAFEVRTGDDGDDDGRERAIHALMLGAALAEIDRHLTPQQADILSGTMTALVPGLICRSLAGG